MKNIISKYKLEVIGALIGAVLGYMYWLKVGCASGTCMITSSPVNSTLYGLLMGSMFLGLFKKKESVNTKN